jgi:hypothetical protein
LRYGYKQLWTRQYEKLYIARAMSRKTTNRAKNAKLLKERSS